MTFHVGVPQIILALLVLFNLILAGVKWGQPRKGKYGAADILGSALNVGILYWGGFFS